MQASAAVEYTAARLSWIYETVSCEQLNYFVWACGQARLARSVPRYPPIKACFRLRPAGPPGGKTADPTPAHRRAQQIVRK
jgi:hypothetical protein